MNTPWFRTCSFFFLFLLFPSAAVVSAQCRAGDRQVSQQCTYNMLNGCIEGDHVDSKQTIRTDVRMQQPDGTFTPGLPVYACSYAMPAPPQPVPKQPLTCRQGDTSMGGSLCRYQPPKVTVMVNSGCKTGELMFDDGKCGYSKSVQGEVCKAGYTSSGYHGYPDAICAYMPGLVNGEVARSCLPSEHDMRGSCLYDVSDEAKQGCIFGGAYKSQGCQMGEQQLQDGSCIRNVGPNVVCSAGERTVAPGKCQYTPANTCYLPQTTGSDGKTSACKNGTPSQLMVPLPGGTFPSKTTSFSDGPRGEYGTEVPVCSYPAIKQ